MKLIYVLCLLTISPILYSAESWTSREDLLQDPTIMNIMYARYTGADFDRLKNILDKADKELFKSIADELFCCVVLAQHTDADQYILLLIEREADLGISIERWAEIIFLYGTQGRKNLVINNHPQGAIIKEMLFDNIARHFKESWTIYDTTEKQKIIKKAKMKLAGEIEPEQIDDQSSRIAQFLKNNKTMLTSVAVASVCVLAAWKLKSRKNDAQEPGE